MTRRGRDEALGAAVLLVLINLTLWPFLWGSASLRDSILWPSVYPTGSRPVAPVRWAVPRELDQGAPSDQTEPWFALEHDIAAHERVAPLWNPYSGFGSPLAANMQAQAYSPFAWIAIASRNPKAYNIFIAARLFAAGLGAFLFLRLFIGLMPSLVGGAAYMYAGYLWLFVIMPEVSVEALLPGVLLGVELVVRCPSRVRIALLALVSAAAFFGGMPESLILAATLAAAYALVRTLAASMLPRRRYEIFGALALAFVLALGLSAIALLPLLEYVPQATNTHTRSSVGLYADALHAAADFYLAPLMHGPGLNHGDSLFPAGPSIRGFFGCSAAFFALIALASRLGDRLRRRPGTVPVAFFGAVAAVCLAKRFGFPPINALGGLPVLRLVIFPKYEEASLACAVSLLAGFGVAALGERRLTTAALASLAAIPLATLTLASRHHFAFTPMSAAAYAEYRTYGLLCSLGFLLGALLVALAMRFHGGRTLVPLGALALVALEPHANYIVPTFYWADPPPPRSADTLASAPYVQYVRAGARDGARFLGLDAILHPNWSAAFGVRDARAVDALYERHYFPFLTAFLRAGHVAGEDVADRFSNTAPQDFGSARVQRLLQLGSIRYLATLNPVELRGPNYRPVFQSDGVSIYAFRQALPRVAVYRHVVAAADDATALALLTVPAFEPNSEAIVESAARDPEIAALALAPAAPVASGRLIADRSREVIASVDARSRSFAVLSDTFYPGWSATLDGRPVPIYRANYLFRGVVVSPGRHIVRFVYEPASFTVGRVVSLLSGCVVLTLLVVRRRASDESRVL